MKPHASFICVDCKEMLHLGKATLDGNQKVRSYHRESVGNLPNCEQSMLNRVLWKMLEDHAGHALRVIVDCEGQHDSLCEYREIGCDDYHDLGFES